MKMNQINIGHMTILGYWFIIPLTKIMMDKGVIFLSPLQRKKFTPLVMRNLMR
jgi:hypothetical protein